MANHTSPIDVIILASDGYYAMVRSALRFPGPGHMRGGSSKHIHGMVWVGRDL